jgi:hypothetical protein
LQNADWVANATTGTAVDLNADCDCSSVAFAGDTLYTDGSFNQVGHELEQVPLMGGPLVPISLSGMPPSQHAAGLIVVEPGANGSAVFAEPQTGSWATVAAAGGPDSLWEVQSAGTAERLVDDHSNGAPSAAVFNSAGTMLLYVGVGHGGGCLDAEFSLLVDLANGQVTDLGVPSTPLGFIWYVRGISFARGGLPDATMVNSQVTCSEPYHYNSTDATPELYIFGSCGRQLVGPAVQVATSAAWSAVPGAQVFEDITGIGVEALPRNVLSLVTPFGVRIGVATDVGQVALAPQ